MGLDADEVAELFAGAGESIADGGDGLLEDLADLLQRQTFVVIEDEDFAEIRADVFERTS
jgi:hypothetical protein